MKVFGLWCAGFACFGALFGIALNAGQFQNDGVNDKVPGLDARLMGGLRP